MLSYQFSTPGWRWNHTLLLNITSWSFPLHPSFPTSVSSSQIWWSFNPTTLFWMMKREFFGFPNVVFWRTSILIPRHPKKKRAHVLSSKASLTFWVCPETPTFEGNTQRNPNNPQNEQIVFQIPPQEDGFGRVLGSNYLLIGCVGSLREQMLIWWFHRKYKGRTGLHVNSQLVLPLNASDHGNWEMSHASIMFKAKVELQRYRNTSCTPVFEWWKWMQIYHDIYSDDTKSLPP